MATCHDVVLNHDVTLNWREEAAWTERMRVLESNHNHVENCTRSRRGEAQRFIRSIEVTSNFGVIDAQVGGFGMVLALVSILCSCIYSVALLQRFLSSNPPLPPLPPQPPRLLWGLPLRLSLLITCIVSLQYDDTSSRIFGISVSRSKLFCVATTMCRVRQIFHSKAEAILHQEQI
jgi:hypothetical protein